jgi:hypothetical protein
MFIHCCTPSPCPHWSDREGNRYIALGAGRYLAERIPGARFVALPGADHLFFAGDTDAIADEIEEFLTGIRSVAEGAVVMAAVLFAGRAHVQSGLPSGSSWNVDATCRANRAQRQMARAAASANPHLRFTHFSITA